MVSNGFQNDFFDEQADGQKERKNAFLGKYSDQRYLPQVKVPIEYTVVIAIGMLIAIIVAYAVGVERGKHVALEVPKSAALGNSAALEEDEKPLLDVALVEKQAAELMKKADAPPGPPTGTVSDATVADQGKPGAALKPAAKAVNVKAPAAVPDQVPSDSTVYTLQLASTKNEEYAKLEVEKLKAKGVAAQITKKGDWFKIYLPCASLGEAEKAKKELGSGYKDCLILKSKPVQQ